LIDLYITDTLPSTATL